MQITTTYETAAREYYAEASDRFEFTPSSADHDAALVCDVVSAIRYTIKSGLERIAREAHGDCEIDVASATELALETLGEMIDGPLCGLWHDMTRVVAAQPVKVAA